MLTKLKNIISDPYEEWVSDRLTNMMKTVNMTFSTFKNLYYDIMRSTIERIEYYTQYVWMGIHEYEERKPDKLAEAFEITKTLNALNNLRLSAVKVNLQTLSDSTIRTANNLANIISRVSTIINIAEASIIKQASSAIRNETFVNIQGWNPENFSESNLLVDMEEGRLTIPFTRTNNIPYIISDVKVDGDPLIIRRKNGNGVDTKTLYYPGYYFGKFLDMSPDFNNTLVTDNISDDTNDTSTYIESYEPGALRVVITLSPVAETADIGYIEVSFGKCSDTPIVETIEVRKSGEKNFRDITNRVSSAGLRVQSVQLSESNRIARVKNGDGYPFSKLTINENQIKEMRITLTVENPEDVPFREYEVIDPQDQVIRRLNFFESLYYDRFSFETGEISLPDTGINTSDIDFLSKSNKIRALRNTVSKRYINIRGIKIYGHEVLSDGYAITRALGRGNTIHSVEIYTEDKVDSEELLSGALQYSITTDGVKYIPIWPVNRANPNNHKTRVIIDPASPEREDIQPSGTVRIRIDMKKGYSVIIPAVYFMSVRIKESVQ
jgi:hypothetical protein